MEKKKTTKKPEHEKLIPVEEIPDKEIIDSIIEKEMGGFMEYFKRMNVLTKKPRYYMAQPYKSNPVQSFNQAVTWVLLLRNSGYNVFSPILHTHHYDLSIKSMLKREKEQKGSIPPALVKTIETETYYAWDLEMLKGCDGLLLANTAYEYRVSCSSCGSTKNIGELMQSGKKSCCDKRTMKGPIVLHWNSIGCRDEYRYAKWVLHIPVYELQSFINGEIIDLRDQLG
jgi:hypothetical protein